MPGDMNIPVYPRNGQAVCGVAGRDIGIITDVSGRTKDIQINVITPGRTGNPYDGPYTVTPVPYENVVLQTKNLIMRNDVTIYKIPYYETTNLKNGLTAYIGGDEDA